MYDNFKCFVLWRSWRDFLIICVKYLGLYWFNIWRFFDTVIMVILILIWFFCVSLFFLLYLVRKDWVLVIFWLFIFFINFWVWDFFLRYSVLYVVYLYFRESNGSLIKNVIIVMNIKCFINLYLKIVLYYFSIIYNYVGFFKFERIKLWYKICIFFIFDINLCDKFICFYSYLINSIKCTFFCIIVFFFIYFYSI